MAMEAGVSREDDLARLQTELVGPAVTHDAFVGRGRGAVPLHPSFEGEWGVVQREERCRGVVDDQESAVGQLDGAISRFTRRGVGGPEGDGVRVAGQAQASGEIVGRALGGRARTFVELEFGEGFLGRSRLSGEQPGQQARGCDRGSQFSSDSFGHLHRAPCFSFHEAAGGWTADPLDEPHRSAVDCGDPVAMVRAGSRARQLGVSCSLRTTT